MAKEKSIDWSLVILIALSVIALTMSTHIVLDRIAENVNGYSGNQSLEGTKWVITSLKSPEQDHVEFEKGNYRRFSPRGDNRRGTQTGVYEVFIGQEALDELEIYRDEPLTKDMLDIVSGQTDKLIVLKLLHIRVVCDGKVEKENSSANYYGRYAGNEIILIDENTKERLHLKKISGPADRNPGRSKQ